MVEVDASNRRVKKKNNVLDLESNTAKQMIQRFPKVNSKSGTSKPLEVAKRIRVYRNGDAYYKGLSFVLNMRQDHTIHTLLDAISERIGLIQGAKRLYTVSGVLIRSTHDLENNNEYVASSGNFIPLSYGKLGTGIRRASFSTTNGARKRNTSSTLNTIPKNTILPAPFRPSRSLEPRNRVVRQTNIGQDGTNGHYKELFPAGRNPKRASALSGESSMNNLGLAGLEIEAKIKPKEKKNGKVVSNNTQQRKEKKNKKVKVDKVEKSARNASMDMEAESGRPASVLPTTQPASRSDYARRESDKFPSESQENEEEQVETTRNEEDKLIHAYESTNHHEESSRERLEKEQKSETPEEERHSPKYEKEHQKPTLTDKEKEENWSPAPGEEYKPFSDSEHEESNEKEDEAENMSAGSSLNHPQKGKRHETDQKDNHENHFNPNVSHEDEQEAKSSNREIYEEVQNSELTTPRRKPKKGSKKKSVT